MHAYAPRPDTTAAFPLCICAHVHGENVCTSMHTQTCMHIYGSIIYAGTPKSQQSLSPITSPGFNVSIKTCCPDNRGTGPGDGRHDTGWRASRNAQHASHRSGPFIAQLQARAALLQLQRPPALLRRLEAMAIWRTRHMRIHMSICKCASATYVNRTS